MIEPDRVKLCERGKGGKYFDNLHVTEKGFAIALEKMLELMPRYEVQWDGCERVSMQNVAGWSRVPVRVLR